MAVDLERGSQLETQALEDILTLQHQHAAPVHLLESQTKHYAKHLTQEDDGFRRYVSSLGGDQGCLIRIPGPNFFPILDFWSNNSKKEGEKNILFVAINFAKLKNIKYFLSGTLQKKILINWKRI